MLITNFASGELSERLYGRADLQTYYQGASRLKNFNILPTGGIVRRNGFRRCGEMTSEARLIPFIVNKFMSYVIEIGPGYIDLWRDGRKLSPAEGNKHYFYNGQETEDEDPETQEKLKVNWLPQSYKTAMEVQCVQNYDLIIFAHRENPPFSIKYNSDGNFTLTKMIFDFEPDIEVIEYKEGVYNPDEDKHLPEKNTTTFQKPGHYPGVVAFYQNRLWLGSTQTEPQKIWASAAPNEKGNRYTTFDNYTHYVTVSKVIKSPDLHIFTGSIKNGTNKITGVSQDLTKQLQNPVTDYYVTCDGIPIATKVTSLSDKEILISNNATKDITSEAMAIQLWQSADNPTEADYEETTEYNDMTTADNGFFFEVASDQNDAVKWICPGNNLIIGTESSEYVVPGGVNALSLQVVLNGRHSSDDIQAIYVGEAVIFFAQGKHSIREYYWNAQEAAFQSNNITIANPEILEESAAIDFDYMNNPYGRLLITKADGTVAVLLYEKSAGILGWSRIEHGNGRILSCATVRSDNSSDTLYAAVQYDDGSVYMEELNLTDTKYLDSWSKYSVEAAEGYSDDAVVFDGKDIYTKTEATNNEFSDVDNVIIGYRYESLIKSMPVVNNNITGSKRITDLQIRFSKSYLPEIVNPNGVTEKITGLTEPYSGIRKVIYPGSSETDVFFTIKTDRPYPCVVLSVNANLA